MGLQHLASSTYFNYGRGITVHHWEHHIILFKEEKFNEVINKKGWGIFAQGEGWADGHRPDNSSGAQFLNSLQHLDQEWYKMESAQIKTSHQHLSL